LCDPVNFSPEHSRDSGLRKHQEHSKFNPARHRRSSVNFDFSSRRQSFDAETTFEALHKKSELSAKGAEYESQGQAPNNVRRVAPGKIARNDREALKEQNN